MYVDRGGGEGAGGGGGDRPTSSAAELMSRPLSPEVEARCAGTKGEWCGNYWMQEEQPRKPPPKGNRACLWGLGGNVCNFAGATAMGDPLTPRRRRRRCCCCCCTRREGCSQTAPTPPSAAAPCAPDLQACATACWGGAAARLGGRGTTAPRETRWGAAVGRGSSALRPRHTCSTPSLTSGWCWPARPPRLRCCSGHAASTSTRRQGLSQTTGPSIGRMGARRWAALGTATRVCWRGARGECLPRGAGRQAGTFAHLRFTHADIAACYCDSDTPFGRVPADPLSPTGARRCLPCHACLLPPTTSGCAACAPRVPAMVPPLHLPRCQAPRLSGQGAP